MSFTYTRSQLKSRINAGIQARIGMLISSEETINEAVRQVHADLDLRSSKRKADLSPKLFNEVYSFSAPADLDAQKIIDIPPQAKREGQEFYLTTPEEFDRTKEIVDGAIAIDDYNGTRRLLISLVVDDKTKVISDLDALESWVSFGDGTNLTADNDNFIRGNGSINWDINASGGTTAGIQNSSLNTYDLTDYLSGNGAVFVWAYLNSATDITNFILRVGSSSANYYSKTITAAHDGTSFVAGWQLLRFDLTSLTQTGTVDVDNCTYAAVYMTKAAGKISETDYRFDYLVLKRGVIHEAKYYSKYGWQSSAGAYKENSTDDADLLVANTDEYNLIITKARELASYELNDFDMGASYLTRYTQQKMEYVKKYPSEAKIATTVYYNY